MTRVENPIRHLVVVDDDEVVTSTLKLYLESAGFQVSTAKDGVRALELASGADVAVVILDLMIPGLSGQEVCRRLREKSSVPVLMLTARTLESERVAGNAVPLTPTEFRVLEALVHHAGRVFTREELVAHAFGPDYDGVDRTMDTHVTNLRRKLAAHSVERFILTVHGMGYRLASPDELPD